MLHIGIVFIVFGLFLIGAGIIPDQSMSWSVFSMYCISTYSYIYINDVMYFFQMRVQRGGMKSLPLVYFH